MRKKYIYNQKVGSVPKNGVRFLESKASDTKHKLDRGTIREVQEPTKTKKKRTKK